MDQLETPHKTKSSRRRKIKTLSDILPRSYIGEGYKRKLDGSNEEWIWHSHPQKIKIVSHLMMLEGHSRKPSILDLRGGKATQVYPTGTEKHVVCLELVGGDLAATRIWLGFKEFNDAAECVLACGKAAATVRLSEFKPISMIGRGKWGKVFVVRRRKKRHGSSSDTLQSPRDREAPSSTIPSPAPSPLKPAHYKDEGESSSGSGELYALKEIDLGMEGLSGAPPSALIHTQHERQVLEVLARADKPSPFVVRMRWALQKGNFLYIVMDFKTGGDLYTALNRHNLSVEGVQVYSAECLLALQHLHEHRIVYRDLKPENMLLHSDGHLCLGDLGLAKQIMDSKGDWGTSRTMCGTEGYVPPEMLAKENYGPSVDIWQFGCFVYELFTGHSPFYHQGYTRSEIRANTAKGNFHMSSLLSSRAQRLVLELLQVDPRDRLGAGMEDGGYDWGEVQRHKFFSGLNWAACKARKLRPPLGRKENKQSRGSRAYLTNFEEEFTNQPPKFGSHQGSLVNPYEDYLQGFDFCDPSDDQTSTKSSFPLTTHGGKMRRSKSTLSEKGGKVESSIPVPRMSKVRDEIQKVDAQKSLLVERNGSLPPCSNAWDTSRSICTEGKSKSFRIRRTQKASERSSTMRSQALSSSASCRKTKSRTSTKARHPPKKKESTAITCSSKWEGVESESESQMTSPAKSIISHDSLSVSPQGLLSSFDTLDDGALNACSDLPVLPSIFWQQRPN